MSDTTKHDGAVERITEMFEALKGTHKEMPVWVADAEFILVTIKTQSDEIYRLRAALQAMRDELIDKTKPNGTAVIDGGFLNKIDAAMQGGAR